MEPGDVEWIGAVQGLGFYRSHPGSELSPDEVQAGAAWNLWWPCATCTATTNDEWPFLEEQLRWAHIMENIVMALYDFMILYHTKTGSILTFMEVSLWFLDKWSSQRSKKDTMNHWRLSCSTSILRWLTESPYRDLQRSLRIMIIATVEKCFPMFSLKSNERCLLRCFSRL